MSTEDRGVLTAIASLPGVGPRRLGILLDAGEPAQVWERLRNGTLGRDETIVGALGRGADRLLERWRDGAANLDPRLIAERHTASGIGLVRPGDAAYPPAFAQDPEPPRLLWVLGDPTRIAPATVAVVGTRRCTRYGHDVARRFGAALAGSGVSVVSGLALGIDAAAHAGALEVDGGGAPVAVVGTGLDVVYPRRNRALWEAVARRGVLFSEAPPGAGAEPWRFPARNRLIAALADVVLVVESASSGGSLYTVDEAILRDVDVWAVPGPITSPVSAGVNRLIADGAHPALDPTELLDHLGVPGPDLGAGDPATVLVSGRRDPEEQAVLDVLTTGAVTFDDLAERSGLPIERLALVTARLQVEGVLVRSGGWYERGG